MLLMLLLPLLLLAGFAQWWLLPRLNDYRDELSGALSDALQKPVRIEAVTATMDGWRLALRLQGVSLHDPGQNAPLAQFTHAALTLNLWRSWQEWRPVVRHIRLEGASVTLNPDSLSQFPGDLSESTNFPSWLLDLRELDIVGESLAVRLPDGSALQLRHPYLHLRETPLGRQLTLTADLPIALGQHLEIIVEQSAADAGWRLHGQLDPPGPPSTPMTFAATPTETGWEATLRHARAEYLLAWAMPWLNESARQWLQPLNPQGEWPEIHLQAGAGTGAYTVTAALREFSTHPVHGLPGFTNITGQLHVTPEQGRIELDSRAVQVDTAGVLRAPITLDTLNGTVNWQRKADGLHLDSAGLALANADLNSRFWGRVIVPDVGKPWLDIHGRYHDVNVGKAPLYLPVIVIPPEGVAWLDRALVSGRVVAGDMTLRGPPAAFPFDHGEGWFETRFQVENAVLDYAPGWPRLERLKTEVLFRNRGLTVKADRGRLLDGDMETATVRIDDLSEVVVQVNGRAKGPAASFWRALKESPVGKELHGDLPDLQVSGVSTLDLELTLPTDERPNQALGRVALLDNGLVLPTWNMTLDRLRGEVRFTENDINASKVQARLRGEPIRLDLDLVGHPGRRALQTRIQGRLGLTALAGESAAALESSISGKSDWNAVLTVPTGQEPRRDQPAFKLDLSSDLRGIAMVLPEPFTKLAGEAQPLQISVQPTAADHLRVDLAYGEDTQAVLALRGSTNALQLERGELRIGAGEAQLLDTPGLAVVARLPRWTWTPSMETSSPVGEKDGPCQRSPESAVNPLALLHRLDARIDELTLAGQTFKGVTVNAARYAEGLRVELDGTGLAGRLTAPDAPTPQQPINAALQKLQIHLNKKHESSPSVPPDPCRLPPLVFTVANLQLNDRDLGRLRFIALPTAQGVRLSDIELSSDRQRIEARSDWQWQGNTQVSRIKALLRSPALEQTLADFGYPDAGVARGATEATLNAEWAGALPDFTLQRLTGTLNLQVGPGQLLDINPGLGRIMGLFNVQNLSRRLSLDFSDLLQPGASFDRITGDLTFGNGQARTDNLTIEAPSARVEFRGRAGLTARDYDQHITVTPSLGGTLPIAGALAGGPLAGAAVFVAERLLQKGIEQATRYRYRLHGSWDDPVLESLTEAVPVPASRPGFVG
ncbi:MAG TPA: TIGR02099 family protein, partial [Gammaproteobacteria bacterium]|nr:TIGR02099 family protein [Gammaproteobacteria bacterium]